MLSIQGLWIEAGHQDPPLARALCAGNNGGSDFGSPKKGC